MLEQTVNLEINEAYLKLKASLLEKGCRVVSEDAPKRLIVRQGSLWGISPKTAQKTLNYNLEPAGSGTLVKCSSRLGSWWKNLTLIGTALSVIVVCVCVWISVDLDTFMMTQQASVWSWIASVDGYVDFQLGQAFVNLTRALALFLSFIIALEVVIYFYVQSRIDSYSREIWPMQ